MYEIVVILNKEKADSKLVRWTDPTLPDAPRSLRRVDPSLCCVAQGFLLESEYEGDNGHPRMSWINPSFAANSVLVPGDVLLEINGKAATSHTQAAKVLAAIVGDVVLKVLAQKPRGGRTTIEAIEAAAGVDAGEDAATKVQSLIRGQQSRKAVAKNAPEPVPAARAKLPEGVTVAVGLKRPPPGMPPRDKQEAAVTTDAERDATAAKEAAATTDAERDAVAAKMQSPTRGRHSRKKMDSANNRPPAEKEAAATIDAERDAAAAKMQSPTRGRHSRKKLDSAPDAPPAEKEAAVSTDAERDAVAAKTQSLTRGRHSRKNIDGTPNAPPAEQEEMGTEELEAAAQEGSHDKHRRRRSVNAIEEHRHRHSTKPEDVGAESSLSELSLAGAAPGHRHRHRRRSTRKTEAALGGEAELGGENM